VHSLVCNKLSKLLNQLCNTSVYTDKAEQFTVFKMSVSLLLKHGTDMPLMHSWGMLGWIVGIRKVFYVKSVLPVVNTG